MAARNEKSKTQQVAEAVARAVNAGKTLALETVDFSDPDRPRSCLEVDFPIIPVNEIATIEGNAMKPIYHLGKWWAWRRSSVFRSMLLAASTRAPEDPADAAKLPWQAYYGNHQRNRRFADLKVADIFMGGGTTLVEGARLGFSMYGTDLNPVAWFVASNRLARVPRKAVEALLVEIDKTVRHKLAPFYACECPRGHMGRWKKRSSGEVMPQDFSPSSLNNTEQAEYCYEGAETIYVFWSKHGPCQRIGCGHRTPILSTPVFATKTITVKAWEQKCTSCRESFEVEEQEARMAPNVPLVVADSEQPYVILGPRSSVSCPHCGFVRQLSREGKPQKKKVVLSLLVHPQWLKGEPGTTAGGTPLGGSPNDPPAETISWNRIRAEKLQLLEVRGKLPAEITCPESGVRIKTGRDGGTVPRKANFACGSCGTVQSNLEAVKAYGKAAPVAAFAIQGYCPSCHAEKQSYGGRFFIPMKNPDTLNAATAEWHLRKNGDLAGLWPRSELPYGFMTHMNNGGIPNHGFTHWWTMFNPRQLLVLTQLLDAIIHAGGERHAWPTREYLLIAFQQYLRNQNMFCFWHRARDHFAPALSNSNYHPKDTSIEVGVFSPVGYGPWRSACSSLVEAAKWSEEPWEIASTDRLKSMLPDLSKDLKGRSERVYPGDPIAETPTVDCRSATDLSTIGDGSYDLVITDPPFGGLLHYSELADFFYVWLRLVLKVRYKDYFSADYTPKTLEAVSNRARHPADSEGFYKRLLTGCWEESHRILKPGGLLAFTFHHSEDAPWVSVLESLFDAGFYLEATYPIRSDETKGEGSRPGTFGSQKIEYDIIHVCRKRREEPKPVSWAKMRRQVLLDVRQLQAILEHHQKEGLPEADLQVIRRGKALEYYSRHYGKVYLDEGKAISVREALLGINQLLDEELGVVTDPPPPNAEPFTRQFLRLFDGLTELPRDQMQKYLRGTGISPGDFMERGWCSSKKKIYHLVLPVEIARAWIGKHRRGMTSDYDQAAFLIGACFDNSGINATATLTNNSFKPHPALGSLLDWFSSRGATTEIRNAAIRARSILRGWKSKNQPQAQQMSLFFEEGASS